MPNDDAVGKGGWGGENVSKSDGVILVRSLSVQTKCPDLELGCLSVKLLLPKTFSNLHITVSMSTLKGPTGRLCSLPTQSHKNGYGEKCGINGV